jgi:hypothetical protein
MDNGPIHARPVTRVERAWRWRRRMPALAASIVLCLVFLVVLGVGEPLAVMRMNRDFLRAEAKELEARQNSYASDMSLASQKVREGAVNHAGELLKKHIPQAGQSDLRGFEWRHLAHTIQEIEPIRTLEGLPAPSGWEPTRLFLSKRFLYNQSDNQNVDQLKAWDLDTWEPVPMFPPKQPASVEWE